MSARPRIGELLVGQGLLTQAQLDQALEQQRAPESKGMRLGQVLVSLGFVNEAQLTKVLSQHLSVPWVSLHHIDFSRQLLNLVPKALAEEFCLIPVYVRSERKVGDTLYLAMEDPTHDEAIRRVGEASSLPVKTMIAAPSDIRGAIRAFYGVASTPAVAPAPAPEPQAAAPRPAPPKAVPPPAPPAKPKVAAPPTPAEVAPAPTPPAASVVRQAPPTAAARTEAAAPATGTPARGLPNVARLRKLGAKSAEAGNRGGPRMIALTLLDGTTIQIPSQKRKGSVAEPAQDAGSEDRLTTRDLIVALRAVANGANREEVLGDAQWETIVAALLSILLKKQLISDWEFVEEWQKGQ